MFLYLFHGSERNLNRKGHGHVQTWPTKAGRVRKRTRKRARKRTKRGKEVQNIGKIKLRLGAFIKKCYGEKSFYVMM